MKPVTKRWDQRLFTVLWVWLAIRGVLPWLVFFRLTFEGDSYSWGADYFGRMFHSSGLARPDFLLIYALLAASITVMWLLRQHNFRFARVALPAYLGLFAANAAYQVLRGEPVMFHGDTLGVHVDITQVFFWLNTAMFVLALAWAWATRAIGQGVGPQPMAPYKVLIVKLCIVFVPLQLLLLMTGEPHALSDEIGVIATMAQWLLLCFALYPGSAYRRQVMD